MVNKKTGKFGVIFKNSGCDDTIHVHDTLPEVDAYIHTVRTASDSITAYIYSYFGGLAHELRKDFIKLKQVQVRKYNGQWWYINNMPVESHRRLLLPTPEQLQAFQEQESRFNEAIATAEQAVDTAYEVLASMDEV